MKRRKYAIGNSHKIYFYFKTVYSKIDVAYIFDQKIFEHAFISRRFIRHPQNPSCISDETELGRVSQCLTRYKELELEWFIFIVKMFLHYRKIIGCHFNLSKIGFLLSV